MKKITTIFERDWAGELGPPGRLVTREPHPAAAWVFAGEGVATRKYDGTSCMIRDGKLFKRLAVPAGRDWPEWFEFVEHEPGDAGKPGKDIGWTLTSIDAPEDRWHREALDQLYNFEGELRDGTYELLGPKIQGNPESQEFHVLMPHAAAEQFPVAPRDYDGLRTLLESAGIEGLVWHHPDGRMAKIKAKDFGLSR